MMAIDPVTCMQETTLIELEPLAPSATVEEGVSLGNHQPGDPDTTLPWDQSQCGSGYKETGEPPALAKAESKGQRRPSPEGIQEGTELECPGEAKAFLSPAPLKEQTEDEVNQMPEKAVHMFIPIDTCCIERTPGHCSSAGTSAWKQPVPRHGESTQKETSSSEKQLFVPCSPRHYGKEQPGVPSGCPPCSSCSKANLKAVASMVAAMILYPCFVYGAYVFLPFDAPPMPSMSIRLIYTLRCGTFATFPIILAHTASSVCLCPRFFSSPASPHSLCRDDCVWHLASLLLGAAALRGTTAGGGDPPRLCCPVRASLHPLLLQPRRAGYLPAPGGPEAHPLAHGALRHLQAAVLGLLCHGPLFPWLRLRPHLPAAAHHASVEPLQHVRAGAPGPVCDGRWA